MPFVICNYIYGYNYSYPLVKAELLCRSHALLVMTEWITLISYSSPIHSLEKFSHKIQVVLHAQKFSSLYRSSNCLTSYIANIVNIMYCMTSPNAANEAISEGLEVDNVHPVALSK